MPRSTFPKALRLPDGSAFSFERVRIMGVLNVTPDSFSDGGRFEGVGAALEQAEALERAGADMLDLGAESTRPGSESVPPKEQLRRLLPVLRGLRDVTSLPISVDTTSARVAEACLDEGAQVINDISAFRFDPHMLGLLASRGVPAVAMHTLGPPRVMQSEPRYRDVVGEVRVHLEGRLEACEAAGLARTQVVLDPGIGFGKRLVDNLRLLDALESLADLGQPVLVGPSRKRFLGDVTGRSVAERGPATAAACVLGIQAGAHMVRVHEPAEVRDGVLLAEALVASRRGERSGVDFQWPPS